MRALEKMFPKLFSSPDTTKILQKIRSRTVEEQDALVEILRENGNSLNICSHIVTSLHEAAAVVVDLIRTKDPEFNHTKHVVMHDHPDIAALQLWNRFNREAVTLHTTFSSDQQIKDKTIASFIGITAPTIGVADSATLIQLTEPGRPRSTSLLPSIHIALLKRENLVADLTEAYALLREESHLDSFVFISGPSKTADIEAHMVNGAHGPREVHVVVLAEPTPRPKSLQKSDGRYGRTIRLSSTLLLKMKQAFVNKTTLLCLVVLISAVFLTMIHQFLMAIFMAGLFSAMVAASPSSAHQKTWWQGDTGLHSHRTGYCAAGPDTAYRTHYLSGDPGHPHRPIRYPMGAKLHQ